MRDYFELKDFGEREDGSLFVELAGKDLTVCPECGNKVLHIHHHLRGSRADRMDNGKPVEVITESIRYVCPECGSYSLTVDESVDGKVTDHMAEMIVRDMVLTDMTAEEIAQKYGMNAQRVIKLTQKFIRSRLEKNRYNIPSVLGVVPVKLRRGRFFLLYDVRNLKTLDVVESLENPELDLAEEIITPDRRDKMITKRFDEKKIIDLSDSRTGFLLEALAEDAKSLNQTPDLEVIILGRNEKKLEELLEEDVSLFPVYAAYSFITAGRSFAVPKNLPRLREAVEKDTSSLRPEVLDEFGKMAERDADRMRNPAKLRLSKEQLIASILLFRQETSF